MHQFNPKKHHRRSIRLKGYDYAQPGAYFITICGYQRKHWFGEVENKMVIPNAFGRIAASEWESLPERFPQITVKDYIIMPNHMHGVLLVGAPLAGAHFGVNASNDDVSSSFDWILDDSGKGHPQGVPLRGTQHLGEMVGAYKSLVADKCLELFIKYRPGKIMGKLWQRNYWEHIIRTETAYQFITNYINNNPKDWHNDRFF